MEFGSINLVVKDPDIALFKYLKLFGTNNIDQVIRLKGLYDTVDTLDGYYLKTTPVNLGIYTPRESNGRMGKYLEKYGEGIHHIDLYLGQDEFEETYSRFKNEGLSVSEKLVYIGKFSEAIFWLEEDGEQGVPVRYSTKAYRGFRPWADTIYLDTPRKFEKVNITEEYLMPRVTLGTIMITTTECDKQQSIWSNILSMPVLEAGNLYTKEKGKVDDGRGNVFIPLKYRFNWGGAINLYNALNEDAPINKILASRKRKVMYHNMCGYATRDRMHDYWNRLEEAGFAMVDPKPLLNSNTGNGNYFFFVHPVSTHGVLYEVASAYVMDAENKACYDWSDVETYIVPPAIN
jgi:hypothetical protein